MAKPLSYEDEARFQFARTQGASPSHEELDERIEALRCDDRAAHPLEEGLVGDHQLKWTETVLQYNDPSLGGLLIHNWEYQEPDATMVTFLRLDDQRFVSLTSAEATRLVSPVESHPRCRDARAYRSLAARVARQR